MDFNAMMVSGFPFAYSSASSASLIPVEFSWQVSRGYCMAPHYFGLKFEGKTYGMHINYLTDHHDIDELTGNARWRYTPCRVEAI